MYLYNTATANPKSSMNTWFIDGLLVMWYGSLAYYSLNGRHELIPQAFTNNPRQITILMLLETLNSEIGITRTTLIDY